MATTVWTQKAGQSSDTEVDNISTLVDQASTSATAAAASASAAAADAAAVAASYDNFDDRYLGEKATDPTVDNDGDALTSGALYFNTTDGVMKVYNSATWDAVSSVTVANISDLTATAAELNIMDGVTATTAEINYVDGVTSNIQTQLDAKGTVSSLSDLSITATATEINYTSGVTSAIQTQLDAKGTVSTLGDLSITASATELNYTTGVTSAIQTQLDAKGTVSSLSDLGVTASATELNYTSGVTSAIQTQLDAKGTVSSLSDLSITATAAELNTLDGITATVTELNYVDGVTSAIQTQIDAKAPTASPTFSGTVSDGDGAIRAIPQSGSAKTTSYSLATSDVGNFIEVGSGGSITIPDATFSAGDAVSIFNNTTGDVTITCSITTAYIGGTDADKATVTLATRGVATILFISGTVCVIAGNVS